ncbi:MAG: hypothetical protein RI554_01620 [Trueperaceae bacterium]|nr:hypothetical protein [Trueperaceae bacterium]
MWIWLLAVLALGVFIGVRLAGRVGLRRGAGGPDLEREAYLRGRAYEQGLEEGRRREREAWETARARGEVPPALSDGDAR